MPVFWNKKTWKLNNIRWLRTFESLDIYFRILFILFFLGSLLLFFPFPCRKVLMTWATRHCFSPETFKKHVFLGAQTSYVIWVLCHLKNGLKTIQTERSISPRGGVTTQQFPKPQDERSRSNSCTRATVGRGKEGREGRGGKGGCHFLQWPMSSFNKGQQKHEIVSDSLSNPWKS